MSIPTCGQSLGVRIAGTGMAVPANVLTNAELAQRVDTTDQWINQRTGIRERRVGDESNSVRQLCRDAMKQALDNAKLDPKQLDFLLIATMTPEMLTPSTAAQVVTDLGAAPAGAVDISAACSGFVYGMNIGWSLVKSGIYKNVGVVGAEMLSRITHWKDRNTCILFGDGAGAAILSATNDSSQGCIYQTMQSDAAKSNELYCPRSEKDIPSGDSIFNGQFNTIQMNGREIFKFAVSTLETQIDKALQACGIQANDLAAIVPHQMNARILESARERMGLPAEKMVINIDRYGNTSAASVALCLHELTMTGRLKKGDLVLMIGLGGGLTWATSVWRL